MRKLSRWILLVGLAMPFVARAESWSAAPLVDHMCLQKVKGDPDAHPTSCLLKCAKSGYGILTQDGTWLKFDEAGNSKALAALQKTQKKDHIRVNVTGDQKGETLAVSELAIAD